MIFADWLVGDLPRIQRGEPPTLPLQRFGVENVKGFRKGGK